jgi:metal-responsive CopG/Arc/MetJ family transcriptional regulator
MRAIQVSFDERLLRELDRDPEVAREGRSAVLRRAAFLFLRQKRRAAIKDAYDRAYGSRRGLGDEWSGWEEQGAWPHEPR